jgi:hypothetical protein
MPESRQALSSDNDHNVHLIKTARFCPANVAYTSCLPMATWIISRKGLARKCPCFFPPFVAGGWELHSSIQ